MATHPARTVRPDQLSACDSGRAAGTRRGTLIDLWQCNGGANQQWEIENGTLVNPASGKCLDDPAGNTTEGTQLDLWTCNGGINQQWDAP